MNEHAKRMGFLPGPLQTMKGSGSIWRIDLSSIISYTCPSKRISMEQITRAMVSSRAPKTYWHRFLAFVPLVYFLLFYLPGLAQSYTTAFSMGDLEDDEATGVAFTSDGRIVTVGYFRGALSSGDFTVISNNLSIDAFIAIHDTQGNCHGLINYGTNNEDRAAGVEILANGNIIVYGVYNSTNGCVACIPFIACFDSDLNLQWDKTIYNSPIATIDFTLKVSENVIAASGSIQGGVQPLNLDGQSLTLPNSSSGFLWVMDDSGSTIWVAAIGNQFGTALGPKVSLLTDNGDLVVVGVFQNSIAIGGESLLAIGGLLDSDSYIAKFNISGDLEWVNQYNDAIDGEGVSTFAHSPNRYIFGQSVYLDDGVDTLRYRVFNESGTLIDDFKVRYELPCDFAFECGKFIKLTQIDNNEFILCRRVFGHMFIQAPNKLYKLDQTMNTICEIELSPSGWFSDRNSIQDFAYNDSLDLIAIAGSFWSSLQFDGLAPLSPAGGKDAFAAVRYFFSTVSLVLPSDTIMMNDPGLDLVNLAMPNYAGLFSGPGVVGGNVFDPALAGPGTHFITWEYVDGTCDYQAVDSIVVLLSTSVEEDETAAFRVNPNPTKGVLWIEGIQSPKAIVNIHDMTGRYYGMRRVSGYLDLSNLAPGIYAVQVIDGERNYFVKVLRE